MIRVLALVLRFFLRLIRDIDGFLTWITRLPFPSAYEIKGECQKRGVCCRHIAVGFAKRTWQYPSIRRLAIWWYEFVYNFVLIGEDSKNMVLIFRCNYLKNNQCSIYRRRPYICRHYPRTDFFHKPAFLPGCGYYAVKKGE